MTDLSRRDFLKLLRNGFLYLSGALALGGLLRFLDFEAARAPKTDFNLGPAQNYPLPSRTVLTEPPAFLIHDESGFRALSLNCCTVESDADGFACSCHGSHFDKTGKVLHGPAAKPLASLRIELTEDNELILHTN